ncbi:C-X-C motif chemokine 2-like [Pagrus major]|uniref:C-X-C motif chemokine 2-like n=1 Tax=Pagrus major TaxID=143350 RepID=UPI003CC8DBF2
MSTGIMKVFLLLAVVVCISQAQQSPQESPQESQQCLCSRVSRLNTSNVKDVQIYPATIFCNRVEIVVTTNSGYRYCLNPKMKVVQRLVANVMNRQKASTATPTTFSSTSGSSSTVRF